MSRKLSNEFVSWNHGTTVRYVKLLSRQEVEQFVDIFFPESMKVEVKRLYFVENKEAIVYKFKVDCFYRGEPIPHATYTGKLYLNDFKYTFKNDEGSEYAYYIDPNYERLKNFMAKKYGEDYVKFQSEFCEPKF